MKNEYRPNEGDHDCEALSLEVRILLFVCGGTKTKRSEGAGEPAVTSKDKRLQVRVHDN